MTKQKPKGKTPTLLAQSTGKPVMFECKRKTKCTRCKGGILSGSKAFQIPKMQSGFTNKKTYCLECFDLILEQTKQDISALDDIVISLRERQ